jgi:3-oxoacyl-[acyl-carrier protein] reductase
MTTGQRDRATSVLDLMGKSAIVTGTSRGIGEAILRSLADLGVGVVGVGRNFPADWWNNIPNRENVAIEVGDITDPKTAQNALKTCLNKFGKVDMLVNNAGIAQATNIVGLKMEDWNKLMDTNVTGYVYFCKEVVPEMVKQKEGGSIVNISSVAATLVEAGLLAYATTKGAIISFTRGLAIDLAPHRITANAIAPGWVRTQMGAAQFTEKQLSVVNERIPLGRIASPDEIAGTVVFLCSGLSRYITGQVITVDGGETCEGTIKGIEY